MKTKNPKTNAEWQDAVDLAHAAIQLHSAKLFGLVTGGPEVNPRRCAEIINRGRQLGIHPAPDAVERFVRSLNLNPGLEIIPTDKKS